MRCWLCWLTAAIVCGLALTATSSTEAADAAKLPVLVEEKFDSGADRWQPTDAKAWKVSEVEGNKVYSQFQASKYKPTHRSPFNYSLLKDVVVGDFVLEAKVQSTCRDYGHRDVCLFFGHQDADHFYYVHLGKQTDDHANQIFIVNAAPRTKISNKTSTGTPWNDEWHRVKLVRTVDDGKIEVYFDDMKTPVMTATNKEFTWGRVGFGTFDDTANFDDIKLSGVKVEAPKAGE